MVGIFKLEEDDAHPQLVWDNFFKRLAASEQQVIRSTVKLLKHEEHSLNDGN